MKNNPLYSISPLDGRYRSKLAPLKKYFSEAALIRKRILIEVEYLIELSKVVDSFHLTRPEITKLRHWQATLQASQLQRVKEIETEIHHDVKAVEYFIKENLPALQLEKLSPWVHWGLTSEDTNNLSYNLLIKNCLQEVVIPQYILIIKALARLAKNYQGLPMVGRTHGQTALPTTVGKELIIFAARAVNTLDNLSQLRFCGKLNGAVGNFNAHQQIFPNQDWLTFSKNFIKKFGLKPNLVTTQIEPNNCLIAVFDHCRQLNNIFIDLCLDCWRYISDGYFVQKIKEEEVGSSTMPHKVNPINFENAEGNFQLANNLFVFLSNKLTKSRLQRDLSDSTVKRNFGVAFGHTRLGLLSLNKGLSKIKPDKKLLNKDLENHPEILTEALQLMLKKWGDKDSYTKIKKQSRGKHSTWKKLIQPLAKEKQEKIKNWQPKQYLGLAEKITGQEIKRINKSLSLVKKRIKKEE
jgi:adenylosuccinate lyase